jgi:hypothetical protein
MASFDLADAMLLSYQQAEDGGVADLAVEASTPVAMTDITGPPDLSAELPAMLEPASLPTFA